MRISPIILFSVDFIIYAILDEELSQDLSARPNTQGLDKVIHVYLLILLNSVLTR